MGFRLPEQALYSNMVTTLYTRGVDRGMEVPNNRLTYMPSFQDESRPYGVQFLATCKNSRYCFRKCVFCMYQRK